MTSSDENSSEYSSSTAGRECLHRLCEYLFLKTASFHAVLTQFITSLFYCLIENITSKHSKNIY